MDYPHQLLEAPLQPPADELFQVFLSTSGRAVNDSSSFWWKSSWFSYCMLIEWSSYCIAKVSYKLSLIHVCLVKQLGRCTAYYKEIRLFADLVMVLSIFSGACAVPAVLNFGIIFMFFIFYFQET